MAVFLYMYCIISNNLSLSFRVSFTNIKSIKSIDAGPKKHARFRWIEPIARVTKGAQYEFWAVWRCKCHTFFAFVSALRAMEQKPTQCFRFSSSLRKRGSSSLTFHQRGGVPFAHCPAHGIHPGLMCVWYQTLKTGSVGNLSIFRRFSM